MALANQQIVVVIGLIVNESGQILLQKRLDPLIPDAHEKWEFPGGKVDFGETPEESLIREVREEIGCEIHVEQLLPLAQSRVWETTQGTMLQVLVFCYTAQYVRGELVSHDPKVAEVGWFSKEAALQLDTLKGIRDFIALV